jgi:hypothetical protein
MITKAYTRKNGGKVFVITGICGLAGAATLRVGLRGRKRSGRRALGLPPEAYTRMIFLADNPDPERVS